ncbi:glycosyltransferase family 4 protein [Pseudodesulfovibrio piezophilus]|uniref:Glycosyl transferase group 1 n=1 Tax=Pseudodesulfovibrio piezophilus (strain DSM 21447 / JCM 15486 / C1TLV30) TaxID=1322246 RepID=M1WMI2_PSEP2|nr:glycosyltransferase [Pseudodesulfovibrio piezophilus]CCH49650.1 Glycosyl transferase group 1 [Pseudodesulfovibrio piezophilus C1TLV30]
MKILHIITGLDVGGAETMLFRLMTGMDRERFTSRVVSLLDPGPMGDRLREAGFMVEGLGMKRGIPSPMGLLRLMRLIRSWRPEVIQTWLYHADLAGLIATRLAFPKGKRPKVVWNIRCSFMALDEYRRMTGITLRACAALSSFPDAILTNSHEARRFHMQLGYTPRRFEVIPNGFDTITMAPDITASPSVRAELSLSDSTLLVGNVARFDTMKDQRTMIMAAGRVVASCDATVLLIGRGMDHDNLEVAAWIAEAGLPPDRVRLLGQRRDIPRLMAAMDIHVSSSIGESFPNVVGESMACGTVNIVTDVGDSALLVGKTGTVIPPSDAEQLAEAILRLCRLSPSERERLGRRAREHIEKKFTLSHVVRHYEEIYEELII